MGRAPCCDKANVKKGPWSPEEDATLKEYLEKHGTGGNWIALPHKAGKSHGPRVWLFMKLCRQLSSLSMMFIVLLKAVLKTQFWLVFLLLEKLAYVCSLAISHNPFCLKDSPSVFQDLNVAARVVD